MAYMTSSEALQREGSALIWQFHNKYHEMLFLQEKLRGIFITPSALPTQCLCSYCFLPSTTPEKWKNPLELISEIKWKVKQKNKTPHVIQLRHCRNSPNAQLLYLSCVVPQKACPLGVHRYHSVLPYVSPLSKPLGCAQKKHQNLCTPASSHSLSDNTIRHSSRQGNKELTELR